MQWNAQQQWESVQFSSVAQLCPTLCDPMHCGTQASLCITDSRSSLKRMSIESVMPASHLILPLSSPSPPSFNLSQHQGLFKWVTSGDQSFEVSASTSVLPVNIQDWFPLGWIGWISLQSKGLSRVFSNSTVQKYQFFSAQLSSQSNSHIHTWPLEKP